jgi:hypothetical protein
MMAFPNAMAHARRQSGFLLNPWRFGGGGGGGSFEIASFAGTENTTDTTDHIFTMPSGIQAGDILFVCLGFDSAPTLTNIPGGWIDLGGVSSSGNISGRWLWKVASGSDTFSFTSSTAEQSAALIFRITGATGSAAISARGQTTSSTVNPSVVTLPSEQTAIFFANVATDGGRSVNAWPTGYDLQYSLPGANTTAGAGVFVAAKIATATSEDPAAFTLSGSGRSCHATVAIY